MHKKRTFIRLFLHKIGMLLRLKMHKNRMCADGALSVVKAGRTTCLYLYLVISLQIPYFSSLRLSTDKLTATDMTTYTAHMANIFAELKPEVIFFIMYETR